MHHSLFQPENVMLLTRKYQQIKLIDFGLSKKIEPGQEQRHMLGKTSSSVGCTGNSGDKKGMKCSLSLKNM